MWLFLPLFMSLKSFCVCSAWKLLMLFHDDSYVCLIYISFFPCVLVWFSFRQCCFCFLSLFLSRYLFYSSCYCCCSCSLFVDDYCLCRPLLVGVEIGSVVVFMFLFLLTIGGSSILAMFTPMLKVKLCSVHFSAVLVS